MYKRILVLCQRKVSNLPKNKDAVDKAVLEMDEYIALRTHEDERVSIEYLTWHYNEPHKAYANHNFLLSRENTYGSDAIFKEKISMLDKFIAEHNNSYDIIILNTCPLIWLDYNMIHNLLKSNGILVVKLFGNKESSPSKDDNPIVAQSIERTIPSTLFIKQQDSLYGKFTYIKKETQALGKGRRLKKAYTRIKRSRLKKTKKKEELLK